MRFARDDTQRMIGDTVSRLLADHNEFAARRERLSAASPDRLALWPQLTETGMIGSGFAEDLGGFGGSARDVAIVQYEFGRSLAVEPYLAVVLSGRILRAAQPDVAGQEIEKIIAGERIVVLAHSEGFDPFAPSKLKASGDDGAYRLDGVKKVVRHADVAHAFIVSARLPNGAQGCFLVEAAADGVSIETYRFLDASGGGTISFNKTPAQLLLEGAAAEAAIADALDWGLAGVAAEACGIMDALNAATREYLRTRVQFGVPIGSFQALQHRSADMYVAGEEAAVATDVVLDSFLDGADARRRSARASSLKALIDRAGLKIGHEAIQLHGGVGVSDELIVSHYTRRLGTIRAEFGNVDLHLARYAALAA